MPQTVRLQTWHGDKFSKFSWMLHPYTLIRNKWTNTWQRERVEGLLVVGQYFRVMRRGSPATNAFTMRYEDLPNKEIYATERMVLITEEGPKNNFSIYRDLPVTPT